MIPMSGDELAVTFISLILGLICLVVMCVRICRFLPKGAPKAAASAVLLAAVLGFLFLFAVLRWLASHDVQEDWRYLLMYSAMGLLWLVGARHLGLWGVSLRDDLLERRNSSAGWAVAGFTLGSSFCFSGGNIGDGPGWWVVVFCALLANLTLSLLWLLANQFAPIADRITIDRDEASGIRAAGFFVGVGLILGRSVAGDWSSLGETILDFAQRAWPAFLLTFVLAGFERVARPKFERGSLLARSIVPALAYVLAGIFAVLLAWPFE